MSNRILKALMQLFAIIAPPDSNEKERTSVVESFLQRQLNSELIQEYLAIFNGYFDTYQRKGNDSQKRKQHISASSVRVLRICTEINSELAQRQKIIVLMLLLEFIKSDNAITEQELEFVNTVAETFFIPREQFELIKHFVIDSFSQEPMDSDKLLLIDGNPRHNHLRNIKHIQSEALGGQIRILNIDTSGLFVMRYVDVNELYINNQPLQPNKVHVVHPGASIRNPVIKPIYYSDVVSTFNADAQDTPMLFRVEGVEYRFEAGEVGLHPVSFQEQSGKLVGIMGASGTGKSTLLNVLNGSSPPTTGRVTINGIDIHSEKDLIKGVIGYVSQDDLLMEDLTVFQNLYLNAKLSLSRFDDFQVRKRVIKTLKSLGLYAVRDLKVGSPLDKKISGGQRKRLNIALELIRQPAVLFLDEPTSGLSSRDSQNIMDLLKELALLGKLVFVVIHQPSSEIFKMFDQLVLLDTGGYLIYKGNPVDAITYFKSRIHHANWNDSECHVCGNVNVEQIFNIIEAEVVDEFGNVTQTRKVSPREWRDKFEGFRKDKEQELPLPQGVPKASFQVPSRLMQYWIFIRRDVLAKVANKQYLAINLLEAPVLALILAFIVRYFDITKQTAYSFDLNENLPVYIFMAVIVATFVGLTVSAQEIYKDQKILNRERFLNLSRFSYLMSKITVLFAISSFQALAFVLLGNFILDIKGMYFHYWVMLFSTWCAANVLGLVVSDSFKTSVTIYILIPFLVIPQIVLSGVIIEFDKINPSISAPNRVPWYGEIITSRWAYEALAVHQFRDNDYERNFYELDRKVQFFQYKKDYWLKELEKQLTFVKRNFADPGKAAYVGSALLLLRNELGRELAINPNARFGALDQLWPEKVSLSAVAQAEKYLAELSDYYRARSNSVRQEKDEFERSLNQADPEGLALLRRQHRNEQLADFVTGGKFDNVITYQGRIYPQSNPIYHYPEHPFLKAHFYAPVKFIGNWQLETFWVNLAVIWLSSLLLFAALYFRWLKKALDFFSKKKRIRLKAND